MYGKGEIGNAVLLSHRRRGVCSTVASEVLWQTILYTTTHFATSHTVLIDGVENNLLINDIGNFKVKIEVKMLCPGATPKIFVGKTEDLIFDLDGFDTVAFLSVGIHRTVLDARAAHVAKLYLVIHRGGAQGCVCDDGNKTVARTVLCRHGESVPAELTKPRAGCRINV